MIGCRICWNSRSSALKPNDSTVSKNDHEPSPSTSALAAISSSRRARWIALRSRAHCWRNILLVRWCLVSAHNKKVTIAMPISVRTRLGECKRRGNMPTGIIGAKNYHTTRPTTNTRPSPSGRSLASRKTIIRDQDRTLRMIWLLQHTWPISELFPQRPRYLLHQSKRGLRALWALWVHLRENWMFSRLFRRRVANSLSSLRAKMWNHASKQ